MSCANIAPGVLDSWHNARSALLLAVIFISFATWTYTHRESFRRRFLSPPSLTVAAPSGEGYFSVAKVDWPAEEPKIASVGKDTKEKTKSREPVERKETQSRPRLTPKRVTGSKTFIKSKTENCATKIQPLIFYFSLTENYVKSYATGPLRTFFHDLQESETTVLKPRIYDLAIIDYEDFFEPIPKEEDCSIRHFYTLLIPSYNIDTALDSFIALLKETHNDFRIDTAPLSGIVGFSVFGFGDKDGWPTESEGYCSQAIEVDKWMAKLTARKRVFPLGLGDVRSDVKERFQEWSNGIAKALVEIAVHGSLGEGAPGSGNAVESDEEGPEDEEEDDDAETEAGGSTTQRPARRKRWQHKARVDDLEDLGSTARSHTDPSSNLNSSPTPIPVDFTTSSEPTTATPAGPKAMVPINSPTHAALTKQGYTIVGTHSGVKICRWTKSALRGRGSCYKYSFYGIKSHLCMETTPSLSCSNKCVFCWRHGTNPVGTTWRWQIDPPEMIFHGAKEGHYKKIKMMRGVPGVRAERFQEAMQIRHCALSLVGEPIFYPHINEFVSMLHQEHISSFLVCNAQHPDQLAALKPVTQLYVSIDASNPESLRKIDRPLHRDYWQRFLRCLAILREKRFRMRTVFRLTLVKGFNIEAEVEGYADLVEKGLPCFVEIKGVTYCGTSSSAGAGLTMQNVPFYAEIVTFVEALHAALERRGLAYGIAAEHAHSCCALIASERFFVEGEWHTLIDYERFFACLEGGAEFSPEDYMGRATPEWATWGNGGFDPADERVYRKGKKGPVKKVEEEVVEEATGEA